MSDHFKTFIHNKQDEMPVPGIREFAFDFEKAQRKQSGNITYLINQYGYRGNILPGGDAAFGCSYTFGFHLDEGLCWPSLMGIFNGAVCAIGNDAIARNAVSYIRNYRPNHIYVMWTFNSRREIVDETGRYLKFGPTMVSPNMSNTSVQYGQLLLNNQQANDYNLEKNQLLVESVAGVYGTILHQLHVDDWQPDAYPPLALNDSHPGQLWHSKVAEHFSKQV